MSPDGAGQARAGAPRPSRLAAALVVPIVVLVGALGYEIAFLVQEAGDDQAGIHGADFGAYYAAAWAVREGTFDEAYRTIPRDADGMSNPHLTFELAPDSRWGEIYRERLPGQRVQMYLYPPPLAVALVPLTLAPFPGAYGIFIGLNLVLLFGSVLIGIRVWGRSPGPVDVTLALLALLLFVPVYSGLLWGQVAGILAGCWAGAAWLAYRGRSFWSGVVIGVGASIKLTPAILFPFMAVRRDWSWCAGFVLGAGVPFALAVALVGAGTTWAGFTDVPAAQACGLVGPQNVSIPSAGAQVMSDLGRGVGLIRLPWEPEPLLADAWACRVSQGTIGLLLLALLAGIAASPRLRGIPPHLQIASVTLLSVVLSPVSWIHAYSQALLPLAVLVAAPTGVSSAEKVGWAAAIWLAVGWPWQPRLTGSVGSGVALSAALLAAAAVPLALYLRLQLGLLARPLADGDA